MRNRTTKLFAALFALSLALGAGLATVTARAQEQSYYVCFSNQSYAIRNANKMTLSDGEYVLENVSLSPAVDFYVTDKAGTRWYGADNSPLKTEETGVYAYDVLFSPSEVYHDTGCHVSYRFYEPASYSINIDGTETALTFNPYHTAYELYYISAAELEAGAQVSFGDETHAVSERGSYRILFTPTKTTNGNDYMFDANGNYGSGDEYVYNLYIEDAPEYFAVFENVQPAAEPNGTAGGKAAYGLDRYENNVTAAEYRSPEFFVAELDFGVKYRVYEKRADGSFALVDDDNNEDTAVSKLTARDVGYYTLSVTDGGESYLSALRDEKKDFGGFYVACEQNGYCYDADGNIDVSDEYKFVEVEDGDDDYDEDYKQYVAYLSVTEAQLKDGDFEFYITDGDKKFKDGADYVKISIAGKYKILCSEEHNYGRGRNFRYVLEDESKAGEEITIGTAAEFAAFAERCRDSADYSIGLKAYITADIDFSGFDFVPVGAFSGTLYGGYHKLVNITSDESSVFETLTHSATVERLSVENLTLGGKNADNVAFVGTNYGTIKYVNVSGRLEGRTNVGGIAAVNGTSAADTGDSADAVNRATIENCSANISVRGESYVGGIVGRNTGDIISCSASGSVSGGKTRASANVDRIGGIAGYGFGKIYDCRNTAEIAGGADSRYVGGIVGLCVGEVYFCFNDGNVSADRDAGGIVGYYGFSNAGNQSGVGGTSESEAIGRNNIINYSVNSADVRAASYAGGIVGNVLTSSGNTVRTLGIENCGSDGVIETAAGSYAGGIAGYAVGADIISCYSVGTVKAKAMNGGNYAGGIVGYGGNVRYSMSAAVVCGDEYIGGIAGYASGDLVGCYTDTLLVGSTDAEHTGEIAGYCSGFDISANKFTADVKCNYYIGDFGGIDGRQYASAFDFAATKTDADTLASVGALSPAFGEEFDREYWQGGDGEPSYPVPRSFEEEKSCDAFGDGELFSALFEKHRDAFTSSARDAARITYTVSFAEWNKDNGALYDDGVLQTDNFDIISSVRAAKGYVPLPEPIYATKNERGEYICEGDDAKYYVSFPETVVTHSMTVYAEYVELVTSLNDGEKAFIEGEFKKGTTATLVKIGDYYTVELELDGNAQHVENATVKLYVGDRANRYRILDADGNVTESTVSGKYIAFAFTSGNYFTAVETVSSLPYWAWLLIGMGAAALVAGVAVLIVWLVKRKKAKFASSADCTLDQTDREIEEQPEQALDEESDEP